LALKYDALVLRESKSIEEKELGVACQEWVTFAKDSLDNGFYSIAEKVGKFLYFFVFLCTLNPKPGHSCVKGWYHNKK
jgi:hypothetical protein